MRNYSGSGNKRKSFKIKDLERGKGVLFLYSVNFGKSASKSKGARKNRFFDHVAIRFLCVSEFARFGRGCIYYFIGIM